VPAPRSRPEYMLLDREPEYSELRSQPPWLAERELLKLDEREPSKLSNPECPELSDREPPKPPNPPREPPKPPLRNPPPPRKPPNPRPSASPLPIANAKKATRANDNQRFMVFPFRVE